MIPESSNYEFAALTNYATVPIAIHYFVTHCNCYELIILPFLLSVKYFFSSTKQCELLCIQLLYKIIYGLSTLYSGLFGMNT